MEALVTESMLLKAGSRHTLTVTPLRKRFDPISLINLGDSDGVFITGMRVGGESQIASNFRLPIAVFEPIAMQTIEFLPCLAGSKIEIDVEIDPEMDRTCMVAVRGRYVDGRASYARKVSKQD